MIVKTNKRYSFILYQTNLSVYKKDIRLPIKYRQAEGRNKLRCFFKNLIFQTVYDIFVISVL